MNEILQANIFFVIASIATVCFCVLVSLILYQILKILKLVESVLSRIEAGSEVLAGDLAQVRLFFSEGGFLSRLFSFATGSKGARRSTKKRTFKSDEDNNNEI